VKKSKKNNAIIDVIKKIWLFFFNHTFETDGEIYALFIAC